MWNRHRFKTTSADDLRPVTFPPPGPWWCSGSGENRDGEYAIMICWLPDGTDVREFWPEAFDVEDPTRHDEITFTSRFPAPAWWVKLQEVR